jgi:hypothetical protein
VRAFVAPDVATDDHLRISFARVLLYRDGVLHRPAAPVPA